MSGEKGEGRPVIYTIGHGSRTTDELLACLRSFEIRTLVDVRSYPTSRNHSQFNRESLERSVTEDGLAYRWLGRELGGLRTNGYEEHMRTELFAEGMAKLLAVSSASPTAIMCAERDPAGCHRRHIARELAGRDVEVRHIIETGRVLLPGERPEDQGTLFPL